MYRPEARGCVIYSPRALPEGAPWLIFTLARIPQGMQKYIDEKCLYCSSCFCFLNTPCWRWWHSQVSRLFNYVSLSKLYFAVNARNSLKGLAVSNDSEPEVEPFITQTKAVSVAVLQELSENNLNLHLRVQTTSKQLTISIFAPRIFRPSCRFTDKEDSGRGINDCN